MKNKQLVGHATVEPQSFLHSQIRKHGSMCRAPNAAAIQRWR
jgi:hypothetical protein